MSSSPEIIRADCGLLGRSAPLLLAALLMGGAAAAAAQSRFEGVGRTATPAEVKAWDIDVRPDLKGLPPGQGSVKRGEQVWEAQCASCHGTFGESNDVFMPLVGSTTPRDIETGHVASLKPGANAPARTTLMKVSQLSTLWDYINRAMPWTAPKSLAPDDVYAVLAYLLNLGNIVPADFTLSDRNMRETQQRLPNRNGMTTAHALWPGPEFGGTTRPDVQGSACIRNCRPEAHVASLIPAYARNAHGNLADQNRPLGPTRGTETAPSEPKVPGVQEGRASSASKTVADGGSAAGPLKAADVVGVLQANVCVACHAIDSKLVGPSFGDVARRYQGRADAAAYLAGKIRSGGQGVWGSIPMPAQSITEADAQRVARWLAGGAAP
ncbi:MAG: c-type cytochrome [Ramlibacter sp.]|nr:c-type cytochrome [Ramlibacter sp.]